MRVRYYCHAGQETGYGRAATELAIALVEAGVDLTLHPLNPSLSHFVEGPAAALASRVSDIAGPADAVIIHTMPLDCQRVVESLLLDHERPRTIIAYTTWEGVTAPPLVIDALRNFHDLWVPSIATADDILESTMAAMNPYVLPHTFTPRAHPTARPNGSLDERFRFYYVGAWTVRKHVHGLIRAFAHAFQPEEPVELVIHSPGVSTESFLAALVQTGLEQRHLPSIVLSNRHVAEDRLWQLHEQADCFVTATRGESWNLPAFEAMLSGRMVIAPGGQGHDDFLFGEDDDEMTDAYRVASVHQPAFVDVEMAEQAMGPGGERGLKFHTVGAQGMTSRTLWRDPDLVHLARGMRRVFDERRRTLDVRYDPAERFGHATVAKMAIDRIEDFMAVVEDG